MSPANSMTADFLLELLSEEIPARMQSGARNDLARMFADEFEKAALSSEAIDVFSTPRRLALIARGLPLETEARREEIKGPRTSAPPQAIDGFLRKTGLKREQLEERDGVLYAIVETVGQASRDLLGPMIERIVRAFPWPKSMRWGEASSSTASLRWVRPLHGIVAMLGDEIVPLAIDGIESGARTFGHRFHHPGPITIGGPGDYAEKLRACHVIVDQHEREELIRESAAKAAADAGLRLVADEGLVVENAGLTEWPVPLLGRFDADYLDVPGEVIVLTMRANQKYFACTEESGALAPAFVCVANIDANDGGEAIVEGNRRVLAARLSDARFFWEQDLKVPLESQAAKLSGIVFHEKLGTVADKVDRVAKLARWLAEEGVVEGANPDEVERAARLAKADLVTGMVGEFPELQGVIGGYLAREQGEPDSIADAIRDHYKPVGQGDEAPTEPVTVAVALADKLDTLTCFFAIFNAPTGSRDPFALRRAALGVIRTMVEVGTRASLRHMFAEAYRLLTSQIVANRPAIAVNWLYEEKPVKLLTPRTAFMATNRLAIISGNPELDEVTEDGEILYRPASLREGGFVRFDVASLTEFVQSLTEFFFERLRDSQRRSGVRPDVISAVLPRRYETYEAYDVFGFEVPSVTARKHDWETRDDPVELLKAAQALERFLSSPEGADLLTAYKRAANILKREKWEGETPSAARREEVKPEEQALISALEKAELDASAAIEAEDFTAAMAALASLRSPIDAFFDHVTVNVDDVGARTDRLDLLMRFRDAVHRVADFSKIEG